MGLAPSDGERELLALELAEDEVLVEWSRGCEAVREWAAAVWSWRSREASMVYGASYSSGGGRKASRGLHGSEGMSGE
jgi:hypothetical protein